jgi:hypothetical protein
VTDSSTVSETIQLTAAWEAWRGDRDALRRLCKAIQSFADAELAKELDEIASQSERSEAREMRERYARDRWAVTATAQEPEYSRTRRGPPDEVIDGLDERTVYSFSAHLQAYGRRDVSVNVGLHRKLGADVRVFGKEPLLVHSLFPEIKAALQRGVPRWCWLRNVNMMFAYSALVALLVGFAFFPYTAAFRSDPNPALWERLLWTGGLAISTGLFLGSLVVYPLVRRAFPGFEVTAPGGEGSGSRLLYALLALVASAALSLGVALLAE